MPRARRPKLVSLTKTEKKITKAHKENFVADVREHVAKWKYVYVLRVGNIRNSALKIVREKWKGTARLFFGRIRVMAVALGTSEDNECRDGIHAVSKHLQGGDGLFFTDYPPDEVEAWFDHFAKPDFARSGNTAKDTITLPVGPITIHGDDTATFPSSMEPQFRKLGLTTVMKRGVPSLDYEHVICKKGDVLTAEQAQLLKLVGIQMVEFKVMPVGWWSEEKGYSRIGNHDASDSSSGNNEDDKADSGGSASEDEE
ncbi:uncharacterized protein EI90DRAFT_3068824 [Cantharellus anzutake]|uniref:uncharacterized protein n=1 Tax=Cantharellus anzutake TaxID=1750568 RepID=UPI001908F325|nr:uncharacterized protein EI90DRAFT_3079148 [Cantharellus anzutake]XP_038913269.1 uncharacterized protein EI90DRAFT_3068824 [Cantharellus anzutake]KAF8321480.1 hypothetical protein EI90DRAFT_3079148 [Cantharellus anzutake]KAF8327005.1 hypothetical protein EI90DRAFT_3068824 [Cantharellus anzutake]